MVDVFIIGSKGIPAHYGGFETFVDDLVTNSSKEDIRYHVACMNAKQKEYVYQNATCFSVKVPNIGAAKAIYYDIKAFQYCVDYIKEHDCEYAIIYILACRIGPFFGRLKRKIRNRNVKVFVNPDGHEWRRAKWNGIIKKYWKLSEKYMIKHADTVVCDSINIEKYIIEQYIKFNPKTIYIAYCAKDCVQNNCDDRYREWLSKNGLQSNDYYLVVGRFVPENNYELIIREYLKSSTKKPLVLVTNIERNDFYNSLVKKTGFTKDERIKFVGTIYDKELLFCIRKNAYAYIHGHSVGGTNPSLLEALSATNINLLFDVGFNQEVAGETAFYFSYEDDSLESLIQRVERLSKEQMLQMGEMARTRMQKKYSTKVIIDKYEKLFEAKGVCNEGIVD